MAALPKGKFSRQHDPVGSGDLMTLQPTAIDTQKAAADILIEYTAGNGGFIIKVQTGVYLGGKQGIRRTLRNGMLEITAAKLEWLQARYKVQPNF